MIKLKEIVKNKKPDVDVLHLLNEHKIRPNKLIYRGLTRLPNDIELKDTPKDRFPRDTNIVLDCLIESYRKLFYSSMPSRRMITFCTSDINTAEDFGSGEVCIVIPKRCDIYSFPGDSIEYTDDNKYVSLFKFISGNYHLEKDLMIHVKNNIPTLYKLYSEAEKLKLSNISEKRDVFDMLFNKNLKTIVTEISGNRPSVFNSSIMELDKYFNNIKRIHNLSYIKEAHEIWITNGNYYLIEFNHFNELFKCFKNRWVHND